MNRRYILILLGALCLNITGLKAQQRDGIEVSMPLTNALLNKIVFDGSKSFVTPSIGYYHQKWKGDRWFKFQSVYYQGYYYRNTFNSSDALKNKFNANFLNFRWGRAWLNRHHEFDDDFYSYIFASMGIGIGMINDTYFNVDGTVENQEKLPFVNPIMLNCGWGIEKKLNDDYHLNSSLELELSGLLNIGLHVRIVKNRY